MKYFGIIIASLLFVSCSDFLVENPKTQLDKKMIYSSAENVNSVLSGCYSSMADYDGFSYHYFHLISSTSPLWVSTKANEVQMTSLNIDPTTLNVEKVYQNMYKTIGITNEMITNLKDSPIKQATKDVITGEAHFIRAMNYFNLVRLFGKVSIITEPIEDYVGAHSPRANTEDVYNLIVADLEKAFALMTEPGSQVSGRPHKYAAKALLAKVYLTMAANDDASPYWQKAYDAGKEAYGKYKLVRPFAKAFDVQNKNNEESIFEIQFNAAQGGMRLTEATLPLGNPYTTHAPEGGKTWGKTRPAKEAFDIFASTHPNDPRIDATFIHTQYDNIFRKKTVNVYPNPKKSVGANNQNRDDYEYPFLKKYIDPALTTSSSCNFVYYRYADLLLVLAEAANELGLTNEAVGYVNEVLDRARDKNGNGVIEPATEVQPLAFATTLSKTEFRSKILTERVIELFGECDDWYTTRRRGFDYFKTYIVLHNNHKSIAGVAKLPEFLVAYPSTDDAIRRNLLLPFPTNEIGRNEAISQEEQNFGY